MMEEIFSDFFRFLCKNTKVRCKKWVHNHEVRCKKWIDNHKVRCKKCHIGI